MSAFRNRHVIVAMLVAPLLALLAWFSADYLFGERPEAAQAGRSYALVEQPGCRYAGGDCGLKNADFELRLTIEPSANGAAVLELQSAFPLDGVIAALVTGGDEQEPQALRRAAPGDRDWTIELPPVRAERDRLRLAATAAGATYFGEVSLKFLAAPELPR